MIENDDLNAWPSDYQHRSAKYNIIEFYHKILWNSQQQEIGESEKIGRHVTFSKDPPKIFEYASEYDSSHSSTLFSSYHSLFKNRFIEKPDVYPIKQVLHASYYNTTSAYRQSYKPIPNDSYFPNSAATYPIKEVEDTSLPVDPPPSYQETNAYPTKPLSLKKRLSQQFKTEKPVVLIQKTLRKIKSTPKLIISERRKTNTLLHKKTSFS